MAASTRSDGNSPEKAARRPWRRPEVRSVGTIGDILKGGAGKISQPKKDTFDAGKPKDEL